MKGGKQTSCSSLLCVVNFSEEQGRYVASVNSSNFIVVPIVTRHRIAPFLLCVSPAVQSYLTMSGEEFEKFSPGEARVWSNIYTLEGKTKLTDLGQFSVFSSSRILPGLNSVEKIG